MRIVVIGAGAIGGCVAGYLKKVGRDVVLIGRQDQVDAINQKGLISRVCEEQKRFVYLLLSK